MRLNNLLDRFIGAQSGRTPGGGMQNIGDALHKLAGTVPGGVAAGGIMALLMSNKSTRKLAGRAAGYGGAALLGALAYRAYRIWLNDRPAAAVPADSASPALSDESHFTGDEVLTEDFQVTLIKAMIAAANADGHIDAGEQQAIFRRVEQMALSNEAKALLFDLLRRPITVQELTVGADGIERKSEVYLASCIAIDPDHPGEQAHLDRLARALDLPDGLAEALQHQARAA